ncbi:DUF4097 family beta strand repeat-containing protein [Streptomyces sp. MP131-18]|uniref:DUF4097 family beta strand repeat-containing protein n=1 Tax=Streptomyces sp. MP131-18 TaxID=1857892 RepID=UPI00097BCA98|nr:DUF4097 family beta strand repeat-containing protein [Streptomyces sp. MP131-18]ONK11393.1 hypothetical protein STBA_21250 [Streptomyces sp. MP131-18]
MAGKSEWSVTEAQTLTFGDRQIDEVEVRIVNGAVNVVGTDDAAPRIEISEISGPPLVVRLDGGRLTVAYDDLPWHNFLKWLDRKGWRRTAVVSVSVPSRSRLSVGVVGASAVISGIAGRTDVRGVSGSTTLVGLSGRMRADTVSGDIEAQALSGKLTFNSVSGNLTVIDSAGPGLKADSVSGDMVVDLADSDRPADIRLNTVSGEVAVRLPHPASARVSASTASGAVSSAFPELSVCGTWGAKQLAGTLGSGSGAVHCSTVSGAIALLRRPPAEFDTAAASTLRKDV